MTRAADASSTPAAMSDDWRKLWFENSHSDIRWCKEQGWKALEGTVVLLAAISAAGVSLSGLPISIIVVMVVVVTGLAVWYMVDLHQSAAKSRRWCDKIVENRPGPLRKFDPDHLLYLCIRIAVVVTGAVLATLIASARPPTHAIDSVPSADWRGFYYENVNEARGTPIGRARLAAAQRFGTLQDCSVWGLRLIAGSASAGFQCGFDCRPLERALSDEVVCKDSTAIVVSQPVP